jgi:hypothetical protein
VVIDWLFGRRAQEEAARDEVADRTLEPDSPPALAAQVVVVNRMINAAAGQLPTAATVTARSVTDVVDTVLRASAADLDIHARVSLNGVLRDYLPTTLRAYLALDPVTRTTARAGAGTPQQALVEQLDFLLDAASDVLEAVRRDDANALVAQGNFLRSKFAGSELEL